MTERKTCGSCLSDDLAEILDLGASPVANNYPVSSGESLELLHYPLKLQLCNECRLVQQSEVVPDNVLWDGDYGFYTSSSPALVSHFREYARSVMAAREFSDPKPFVIEVGSNDGTLLGMFAAEPHNCQVLGIDPAEGPAAMANDAGLPTIRTAFNSTVAHQVVADHGKANLVIANNVAAHVADLHDFLAGLSIVMKQHATLVLEVQYVADLLVGNGFDMVYHEHRSFFSLTSLEVALKRHGIEVWDVEHVSTQSGSIRVTARKEGNQGARRISLPRAHRLASFRHAERFLSRTDAYGGLQARANHLAGRLRDVVETEQRNGWEIVGYGAPAKATTLLHWAGIHDLVSWVVDLTPAKIGRYMPGTAIPIMEPIASVRGGVEYLLLAHNYLGHVLRNEREYVDRGGRFILPLPTVEVI